MKSYVLSNFKKNPQWKNGYMTQLLKLTHMMNSA